MNFVMGPETLTNSTNSTSITMTFDTPREAPVSIKALNDIAQELDELSDEMPALADLSERIGKATEALEATMTRLAETAEHRPMDDMPRYLREIMNIVQREIAHGRGYRTPRDDFDMERMIREYHRFALSNTAFKPAFNPVVSV